MPSRFACTHHWPAARQRTDILVCLCPQAGSVPPRNRKQQQQQPASSIPPCEHKQLQAFLRRVYSWRGWQGGTYCITQAWHAVESEAATPAGGSWQAQFPGKQLTDANCDALLRLIDTHFCGCKVLRRMKTGTSTRTAASSCVDGSTTSTAVGVVEGLAASDSTVSGSCADHNSSSAMRSSSDHVSPGETAAIPAAAAGAAASPPRAKHLRCRVVQSWDAAWLAYFDTDDNVIYINCWRWAKDVSSDAPINCEGVVCVSRLQMLMHTLAHELVHAVVFHLFPDIDRCCPAYTANSRHGPIFHLLNKQLFGHSSDALENVLLLSSRAC